MAENRGSSRKPAIEVQPRGDRWAVQKQGTSRAGSVHDTKRQAERVARDQAKRDQTELIVKDQSGKIERRDSHGHDPHPPKG
jgi:hypothetical protein